MAGGQATVSKTGEIGKELGSRIDIWVASINGNIIDIFTEELKSVNLSRYKRGAQLDEAKLRARIKGHLAQVARHQRHMEAQGHFNPRTGGPIQENLVYDLRYANAAQVQAFDTLLQKTIDKFNKDESTNIVGSVAKIAVDRAPALEGKPTTAAPPPLPGKPIADRLPPQPGKQAMAPGVPLPGKPIAPVLPPLPGKPVTWDPIADIGVLYSAYENLYLNPPVFALKSAVKQGWEAVFGPPKARDISAGDLWGNPVFDELGDPMPIGGRVTGEEEEASYILLRAAFAE